MEEPEHTVNEFGQPIGIPLRDWVAPSLPPRERLVGALCRLEPLRAERDAAALHAGFAGVASARNWTYLPYGPFPDLQAYATWLQQQEQSLDPLFFTIYNAASETVGHASYLRIAPNVGSIEIGHLNFSPRLQRTAAATEAIFLMIRRAFDLGYRRCEWKCDALNGPSRNAALRLGFRFEGIFRQATIYKGRNRDTAWFSIIDKDWPQLREAFGTWLSPANFTPSGGQRLRLSSLTSQSPATR